MADDGETNNGSEGSGGEEDVGGGDGGGADTGGGGGGTSTTTVIIIVVVVAAVIAVAVAMFCCWRRKKRRRGRRDEESKSSDVVDGEQPVNKIQTLGKQYRLESIDYANSGADSSRKMSLLQDLRREEEQALTAKAAAASPIQETDEGMLGASLLSNGDPKNHEYINIMAARQNGHGPSSGLDLSSLTKSDRSQSTYLDYPDESTTMNTSRQNSVTSQHFTMQEIIKRTTLDTQGTAPLAKHESLHSLAESKESSMNKTAPAGATDPNSLSPSSPGSQKQRPYSEYNASEAARFVPKLPPKKKRALQHKSAVAVGMPVDEEQQRRQQRQQQQQQRLVSSRSETCITQLFDQDYDELPEENRLPILPPKTKPLLPPKQKINKSQDDLARIESQLRHSMSDLKTRAREEDYDDLPEEETQQEQQQQQRLSSPTSTTPSHNQHHNHEFQDYDDPVVHVIVTEDDYDDPPVREVDDDDEEEDEADYGEPNSGYFAEQQIKSRN